MTTEYEVQGNYGHGYECVTSEATKAEANERLREYRENEPGVPFRVRRVTAETVREAEDREAAARRALIPNLPTNVDITLADGTTLGPIDFQAEAQRQEDAWDAFRNDPLGRMLLDSMSEAVEDDLP
jgi:hypothetical protein